MATFDRNSALQAGYSPQEIDTYLATQNRPSTGGNFLTNLVGSLTKPFVESGRNIAAGAVQAPLSVLAAGAGKARNIQALPKPIRTLAGGVSDVAYGAAQGLGNLGLGRTEQEFRNIQKRPGDELLRQAGRGAQMASWGIPVGKGLMGALSGGAAIGGTYSAGRQMAEETRLPSITETAIGAGTGAVTAGAIKGAGGLIKGLGKLKGITKRGIEKKMVQGVTKTTPEQYRHIVEESGMDINRLARKHVPAGSGYDDLVGTVTTKGKGGIIGEKLTQAETQIQNTVRATKGTTIRINGESIIRELKNQLKLVKGELGGESRTRALENIIKQVESKYKNGITVTKALETLRIANKKFGEKILETDPGEAIAKASQKVEANTLRNILKTSFPTLREALDTQAELLTLRPMLLRGKSILETQGSEIRRGAITRLSDIINPLAWLDAIANKPEIATRWMGKPTEEAIKKVPSVGRDYAGNIIKTLAIAGQIRPYQNQSQDYRTDSPNYNNGRYDPNSQTDHTPTISQPVKQEPILSLQGQWKWDEAQQDWIPNTQESTSGFPSKEQFEQALFQSAQTGDPRFQEIQSVYKLLYPEAEGTTGKVTAKDKALADTGLSSITEVRRMIQQDPNLLTKQLLPGKFASREFDAALYNAVDALLRLRTGAQANPSEIYGYMTRLGPTFGDSAEAAEYKLQQLERDFNYYQSGLQSPSPIDVLSE